MGLLGATAQLAGLEPWGPLKSAEDRAKSSTRVNVEIPIEETRPIGAAALRWRKK